MNRRKKWKARKKIRHYLKSLSLLLPYPHPLTMRIKITIQINQTAHTSLLKLSVIQPGHRNVNTPSSGHYSQAGKEKRAELASLILVSKGVGVEDTKADLPVSFFHGYPCEWVARVSRMRKRDRETRSGRQEVDGRRTSRVKTVSLHHRWCTRRNEWGRRIL